MIFSAARHHGLASSRADFTGAASKMTIDRLLTLINKIVFSRHECPPRYRSAGQASL
jgi:hypothetical protein